MTKGKKKSRYGLDELTTDELDMVGSGFGGIPASVIRERMVREGAYKQESEPTVAGQPLKETK